MSGGGPLDADPIPTVEPAELERRLRAGDAFDLLDVRDRDEWELGHVDGARHAPASSFPAALAAFDAAREIVVYCKTGVRSARVAGMFRAAGFPRVAVLDGGVVRWAEEIDPTVAHT